MVGGSGWEAAGGLEERERVTETGSRNLKLREGEIREMEIRERPEREG